MRLVLQRKRLRKVQLPPLNEGPGVLSAQTGRAVGEAVGATVPASVAYCRVTWHAGQDLVTEHGVQLCLSERCGLTGLSWVLLS